MSAGRYHSGCGVPGLVRAAAFLPLLLSSQLNAHPASFAERAAELGLEHVEDVPLSGGVSRFDYQSIDEGRRRLYISHLGADLVTVVDMDSGKVVADIRDIPRPHGILAVPGLGRVYVSATGRDQLYVIDENSLKVTAKIPAGRYPDGIAFVPELKRLFVSDETGGTVAVIDAPGEKLLKKIAIGGEVGNTHYDPVSGLVYSTNQTNDVLVAIDPRKMKVLGRYKLSGCAGAHGFYIDAPSRYAFVTGEDNASYVVFDLEKKEIIARGRTGASPDVLAFDGGSRRLYVASESGVASLFILQSGKVRKAGEAFFAPHAHTVSVDRETRRVFFPLENVDGRPVLRIMKEVRRDDARPRKEKPGESRALSSPAGN